MWRLLRKKTAKPKGLVCVSNTQHGFSLSYKPTDSEVVPHLSICQYVPLRNPLDLQAQLKQEVQRYHLTDADCSYVLDPADYRLLVVNKPNVPDAELKSAMKWVVKDLIDFPVEEASVDLFSIPPVNGVVERIYVVITQSKRLIEIDQLISSVGLNLKIIDVAELAVKNLMKLIIKPDESTVFLQVSDDQGCVSIMRGGAVYLIRRIMHDFTLEVQRSMDYYQSQLHQPPVSSMYLLPYVNCNAELLDQISRALTIHPILLNVNELLKLPRVLSPEFQAYCLTSIAGVLRRGNE